MSDDRSDVTDATREAEAEEALAPHGAGPEDAEYDELADDKPVEDDVRNHYREMTELGANDKGEGRIP